MRFNDIKESVVKQFKAGIYSRVPYLEGAPGGGKSACAAEIMKSLGIPEEKLVVIHASLYEPCDVLGLPDLKGDFVKWLPAEMFYKLRKGQGKCGLIIEELPDALIPMQNALCGVIYDRRAGQLPLTDELAIVATGNRVKDKSGANRIVSKLANRVSILQFQETIEDWAKWAVTAGIHPLIISFLRFRPELLSQFDPNRFSNPTPRSWERVSKVPMDLPDYQYHEHVQGEVGEGAGTEFASFMQVWKDLPDLDEIFNKPKVAPVPTGKPATLYALSGALSRKVTLKTMDAMVEYLERIPAEFSVMTIKDAVAVQPQLSQSKAFGKWAMRNADVLV